MTESSWRGNEFVVVDVEGNGGRPPELVELAIVPISAGAIGTARSWLVKPSTPITWQARKIHGITNRDVAEQPAFAEIADEVCEMLAGAIPVGHNVAVDLGVIGRELPDWQPAEAIDTLRLARKCWPQLASHKLGALADHLNLAADLPTGLRPHRAEYDALVTARLFVELTVTWPWMLALRKDGSIKPRHRTERQLNLFD